MARAGTGTSKFKLRPHQTWAIWSSCLTALGGSGSVTDRREPAAQLDAMMQRATGDVESSSVRRARADAPLVGAPARPSWCGARNGEVQERRTAAHVRHV